MENMDFFGTHANPEKKVQNVYNDQFPTSSIYTGLNAKNHNNKYSHKLEKSEQQYDSALRGMEMERMKKIQGIHAPLKFCTELKLLSQQGGRLPCLSSSNLSRNIILGTDSDISVEEVYNASSLEVCGNPQLMVEHGLKIK